MGGRLSRREVVPQTEHARDGLYKYPPPDGGNYFSSHFRLGNRKYETGEPEYFLFGDLTDVNFLSMKPVQFPYKQPDGQAPFHCLQALINVHKDSVRFTKSTQNEEEYFVVFEFNSDVDCRISLLSTLPDSTELSDLRYSPGSGVKSSQHHLFSKGSEVIFTGTNFPLSPGEMDEESLTYDPDNGHDTFPLAILMETADGSQYQSQLTLCTIDKSSDGGYTLKVLKQKLWVDGVEYLLHEMYGLENKAKKNDTTSSANSAGEDGDDDIDDGGGSHDNEDEEDEEEDLGAECVVCITDVRDTLLLPCRHLCLCAACAANLRYQSNNCPICRTPFKALLQITALQPLNPSLELDDDEVTGNPRYEISGFEKMPLLEALNGYKLKLPSEVEEEEEEAAEGGQEGEAETLSNGTSPMATAAQATDTVISVEDDSEIEALSKQPLATPTTSRTHLPHRDSSHGDLHINIDDGHDIPGLITSSTPEVEYKSVGGSSRVVTVVVKEGKSVGCDVGDVGEVGESVSQESDTSCITSSSESSTRGLLHKHEQQET